MMMMKALTIARLVFYPLAALSIVVLMLPTLVLLGFTDSGRLTFWPGFFFQLSALACSGMLFQPVMRVIRRYAAGVALRYKADMMLRRNLPAHSLLYRKQAENAEWRMLVGMFVLFVLHLVLGNAGATAKTDPEVQPKAHTTDAQMQLVRQLQDEYRLNEHGVIRALRYLRQGYSENEVRNLFAPNVRK
jgi:hypothetical protein